MFRREQVICGRHHALFTGASDLIVRASDLPPPLPPRRDCGGWPGQPLLPQLTPAVARGVTAAIAAGRTRRYGADVDADEDNAEAVVAATVFAAFRPSSSAAAATSAAVVSWSQFW